MDSKLIVVAGLIVGGLIPNVFGHVGFYHPSMYGFNVTMETFPYDNRPMAPLMDRTFNDWWWHGHKGYPPHPGDVFEWPAGGKADVQVACNKGYTSWWKSSEGSTDISDPSGRACGDTIAQSVHASSINDVMGCGIAIADKANADDVKPEDFVIFTVKHHCPWLIHNDFEVPADMPACSQGVCHCAWFWIHAPDAGGEQMFMNAFKCKVTNVKPTAKKIAKGKLARRCGAEPAIGKPANPANCTVGAKLPLYWYQKDGNNMFEGTYSPPYYNDLYGFKDGAQNDIFTDVSGNTVTTVDNTTDNNTTDSNSNNNSNNNSTDDNTTTTNTTTNDDGTTSNPTAAASKAKFCKRASGGTKKRKLHNRKRGGSSLLN